MSLTTGRAPHGLDPAGRFDRPMPAGVVYVEPFLRRVRGVVGQRTVVDSERVLLVHRPGSPPSYAFPAEHVRDVASSPEPAAEGYVRVAWDSASRAPQLYAHRDAVRTDLLVPSTLRTYCPYKGTASHWSALVHGKLVPDVAWSYGSPVAEAAPIADWLSFYSERTTMTQDVPTWFSAPPPRSSHG